MFKLGLFFFHSNIGAMHQNATGQCGLVLFALHRYATGSDFATLSCVIFDYN